MSNLFLPHQIACGRAVNVSGKLANFRWKAVSCWASPIPRLLLIAVYVVATDISRSRNSP